MKNAPWWKNIKYPRAEIKQLTNIGIFFLIWSDEAQAAVIKNKNI